MISGDFTHCKDLNQFYYEIRNLHEEAHGDDYCNVHSALRGLVGRNTTYREFGVNQGATAAAVMLKNPKSMTICDIHLDRWLPYKHLFCEYAEENNISFSFINGSSIDEKNAGTADVTYIDTMHQPHHLSRELNLHSKHTNRFIVCHDTYSISSLQKVIEEFTKKNEWNIFYYNKSSVGYTVLMKENI